MDKLTIKEINELLEQQDLSKEKFDSGAISCDLRERTLLNDSLDDLLENAQEKSISFDWLWKE